MFWDFDAFDSSDLAFGLGVVDADGSNLIDLTPPGFALLFFPAWSPDGTRIVFSGTLSGAVFQHIFVMNTDGSGVSQLPSSGGAGETDPDWQPIPGLRTAFADLALTLEAKPKKVAPTKKPLVYTLTITNNGPSDAAGVVVTDVLDTKIQFSSVATTKGTCTPPVAGVNNTVSCDLGQVRIAETVMIEIVADVPSAAKPSISNTASVGGFTADAVVSNNTGVLTMKVVGK